MNVYIRRKFFRWHFWFNKNKIYRKLRRVCFAFHIFRCCCCVCGRQALTFDLYTCSVPRNERKQMKKMYAFVSSFQRHQRRHSFVVISSIWSIQRQRWINKRRARRARANVLKQFKTAKTENMKSESVRASENPSLTLFYSHYDDSFVTDEFRITHASHMVIKS